MERSTRSSAPSGRSPTLPGTGSQPTTLVALLSRFSIASRTGLVARRPELAWIAGNDAFGGSRADAPSETLRLAWVVRFDASGPLTERVRSVEIWIDAGDGSLLGGDVVE